MHMYTHKRHSPFCSWAGSVQGGQWAQLPSSHWEGPACWQTPVRRHLGVHPRGAADTRTSQYTPGSANLGPYYSQFPGNIGTQTRHCSGTCTQLMNKASSNTLDWNKWTKWDCTSVFINYKVHSILTWQFKQVVMGIYSVICAAASLTFKSAMLKWIIPFLKALHWPQWFSLCHYCRQRRWVLEYFESSVAIRDGFCPVHPRPTLWSWYFYTPLFLRWTLAREVKTEQHCGRRMVYFLLIRLFKNCLTYYGCSKGVSLIALYIWLVCEK